MIDFTSFLNTVITMFIILIVGYVLGKINVIDGVASKKLSSLIVVVAQPALIINSIISKQYSPENLSLSLLSLALGLCMHAVMSVIAFVACLKILHLRLAVGKKLHIIPPQYSVYFRLKNKAILFP